MEVQVAQEAAAEAADVGADAMAEVGEAAVAVVATQ